MTALRLLVPLLLLTPAAAGGQTVAQAPLGPPQSLGTGAVELALNDADVSIRVSRADAPFVRASFELAAEQRGGVLHLTGPEGSARRLRLELSVQPLSSVGVSGTGLNLEVIDDVLPEDVVADQLDDGSTPAGTELAGRRDDPVYTSDDEDVPDGDRALADNAAADWSAEYGKWTFNLESSQLLVRGLRNLELELRTSESVLQKTAGPLLATVNGGQFDSADHGGKLDLLITDAAAEIRGHSGPLKLDQLGGSVIQRDGNGRTKASVEEGTLRVDGRRGRFDATGTAGRFDFRDLLDNTTTVAGQDHDVRLEDSDVPFHTRQTGGTFEIRGGTRTLFIQATDLELDIIDFEGLARGSIKGGALKITSPEARLQLQASQSRLAIEGLRQLRLTGAGLVVEGIGVDAVQQLELMDSEIDLDLSPLRHDLSVVIGGQSQGRFTMTPPCLVKVGGRQGLDRDVNVSGCDLRTIEQSAVGAHSRERYGEGLRRLTLMLSGEPEIEVEGR